MAGRFSRITVTVTTDASGNASVLLPQEDADTGIVSYSGTSPGKYPLNGEVRSVIYTKVDFVAGVDFSIVTETGQQIWVEADVNASKTVHPLVAGSSQTGAALVFAAAGEPVPAGPPVVADDGIRLVISSGGNAKSGTFTILLG